MSDGCAKQYRSTQTQAIPLSGHSARADGPSVRPNQRLRRLSGTLGRKRRVPQSCAMELGHILGAVLWSEITRDDSAVLGSLQYPMPENYPNINLLVLNPKRKRPNFPNFMGKRWGNFAHRARPLYSRTFEGGKRQHAPRESQV